MQTNSPIEIAQTLAELRKSELAGPATATALGYLEQLFGRRGGTGIEMAARALRFAIPDTQVSTLATSFIERMLAAPQGHGT